MIRREFVGNAVTTQLSEAILSTTTIIPGDDISSFPLGSTNPFVISIGRGTANEEKILVNSRTASAFGVAERGYDGTTAVAHSVGETIDHVLDATAVQDMNTVTYDTSIIAWMGI